MKGKISGVMAVLAAGFTLAFAACGAGSIPNAASTGTLTGRVTAGPTCPVEREGHPCPPAPVSATVQARSSHGRVVGSTHTDANGRYRFQLPPGVYVVAAVTKQPLPRCPPIKATIKANQTTNAGMSCDTGIR